MKVLKVPGRVRKNFFLPENPLTIDGILVDVFPGDKITC